MARPAHLEPRTRRFCRGLVCGLVLGALAWLAITLLALGIRL